MGNVVDLKMAASGDEQPNPDAPIITFDTFWRAYPRRVARKDAEKAWAKIPPEQHQQILNAITQARKSDDWRRDEGRYIPYPASYLRGERWTDELESDLTMGQCCWNQNGGREEGKPRCPNGASVEKNGVVYCKAHAGRVN
jgi:hypothetical protein